MFKLMKFGLLVLVVCAMATPVFAADEKTPEAAAGGASAAHAATPANILVLSGAAAGAGLVFLGAGFGIGKLAASAVESMARQPEVAGNIQTAMIIAAALIEGVTFFALIVCWVKG